MSDLLNRGTGRDLFNRPSQLGQRPVSKRVAATPLGQVAATRQDANNKPGTIQPAKGERNT